jgi:hypothetical protein
MQNSIHRQDLFDLSLKSIEQLESNNNLATRLNRCFVRSFNKIKDTAYELAIKSLPAKVKLAYFTTLNAYKVASFAYSIIQPTPVIVEGLSSDANEAIQSGINGLLDEYLTHFFPKRFLESSLLIKGKKGLINKILSTTLSQFPKDVIKKIEAHEIKRLFKEGYVETFREILKEKAKVLSAEFVEDKLVQIFSSNLSVQSLGLKEVLTKREIINEGHTRFIIEKKVNPDGTYTVELYSNAADRMKPTFDHTQIANEIIVFENLTEKQYSSFCQFIEEIKTNTGDHLSYTGEEFPDVIRILINKPYVVKVASSLHNGLFFDNPLLYRFRQKAIESVFGKDLVKTDEAFFSLLIAELAISYYQRQDQLKSREILDLLNQLSETKARIEKSPAYPNQSNNLETIKALSKELQSDLKKSLQHEISMGEPKEDHVIPPMIWKMADSFFSVFGHDTTLLEKISLGLEMALGQDYSSLIQSVKEEYLKKKNPAGSALDFSQVSFFELAYSVILYAFIRFAIFDLIWIVSGFIFPPAFAYGTIASTLLATSISYSFDETLLPERMRLIAHKVFNEITYSCVPHLIEIGFYFFVNEEIQKELSYQLQLIDAYSFKSRFKPSEEKITKAVIDPDESIQETAKAIHQRLYQVRTDFYTQIIQEKEATDRADLVKPLLSSLQENIEAIDGQIEQLELESCYEKKFSLPFINKRLKDSRRDLLKFIDIEVLKKIKVESLFIIDESNPALTIDKPPFYARFLELYRLFLDNHAVTSTEKITALTLDWVFDIEKDDSIQGASPKKFRLSFSIESLGRTKDYFIEANLKEIVDRLTPGTLHLWGIHIKTINPQYKKQLELSQLTAFREFATRHPIEEFQSAIISHSHLASLSNEAFIEHLKFWKSLLRSELMLLGITRTERSNFAAFIDERISPLFIENQDEIYLDRPNIQTTLKSTLESLLPHVAGLSINQASHIAREVKESLPSIWKTKSPDFSIGVGPKVIPERVAEQKEIRLDFSHSSMEVKLLEAEVVQESLADLLTRLETFEPQDVIPILKEAEYQPIKSTPGFFSWASNFLSRSIISFQTTRPELESQLMANEILFYFDPTELDVSEEAFESRVIDSILSLIRRGYETHHNGMTFEEAIANERKYEYMFKPGYRSDTQALESKVQFERRKYELKLNRFFSHEERVAAFRKIEELDATYPNVTIRTPDELFGYFNAVVKVYKKQMRIFLALAKNTADLDFISALKMVIRHSLEKAIKKISICYETVDHPFFGIGNWSIDHTNRLCRLVHQFELMQQVYTLSELQDEYTNEKNPIKPAFNIKAHTYSIALWIASSLHLIEKLLERENSSYKAFNFHLPYLMIARQSKFLEPSAIEATVFERLARTNDESFDITSLYSKSSRILSLFPTMENNGFLIYLRKPSLLSMFSYEKTTFFNWGFERKTIFPQPFHDLLSSLPHDCRQLELDHLLLTSSTHVHQHAKKVYSKVEFDLAIKAHESILENLLIHLKKMKRACVTGSKKDDLSVINHCFDNYVFHDLKRFEAEISNNTELALEILTELIFQNTHSTLDPHLMVFLDECLRKYCSSYKPLIDLKEYKKASIQMRAYRSYLSRIDTLEHIEEQKILFFLFTSMIDFSDLAPSIRKKIEHLKTKIHALFFLEKERLKKDEAFIKKVFQYLFSGLTSGSICLDDCQIEKSDDSEIVLKDLENNNRYRLSFLTFQITIGSSSESTTLKKTSALNLSIDPKKDITWNGLNCFAFGLKKQKDATHLKASIAEANGQKTLVIHDSTKVFDAIKIPDSIDQSTLLNAILSGSSPYVKLPIEEKRLPPLINRFASGRVARFYETFTDGIQIEIVGLTKNAIFQLKEDEIFCPALDNAKLSLDQTSSDRSILGNYLVFERSGKKFAIYEQQSPIVSSIIAFLNSKLGVYGENINPLVHLIPSFQSVLLMIQPQFQTDDFSFVNLNSKGQIEPQTIEDFALILFHTFKKDFDRFNTTLQLLLMKIELNEPLKGSIQVNELFTLLGLIALTTGDLQYGKSILETSWIYLQACQIHGMSIPLQNKAILFGISSALYLKHLDFGYQEIEPIAPSIEVIFVNLLFTTFDDLLNSRLNQRDEKKKYSPLEKLLHQYLYPCLFMLFSESFQQRISQLDDLYPHLGSHSLKIDYHLIARKIFRYSSSLQFVVNRFSILPNLTELGIKALATTALTWIPTKSLNFEELKSFIPQDPSQIDVERLDEATVRNYFYYLLEILFLEDEKAVDRLAFAKELKIKLDSKLKSLIISTSSKRQALGFLQYLYQNRSEKALKAIICSLKLISRSSVVIKSDLKSLKPYFNAFIRSQETKITEPLVDRSVRELKAFKDTYATPKTFLQFTHAFCASKFPEYLPKLTQIALIDGVVQGVGETLVCLSQRKKREMAARYAIHPDLIQDHAFFEEIFQGLKERYFTTEESLVTQSRSLLPINHFADKKLEDYLSGRIEESYAELLKGEKKGSLHQLKLSKTIDQLKQEMLAIKESIDDQIELLSQEILSYCNLSSCHTVTINELYKIALEENAILILKAKIKCRTSIAELLLSRITMLALYTSYSVKAELVLKLIQTGANLDEIAIKVAEKKHYPITIDGNLKFILGCLFFEAKNKVWLRELQAKQMLLALEDQESSCLIEMIPGSGKTAFAILLDLFHRHEKGKASFAVFTQSLITSTKEEVAKRFLKFTGKRALFMQIDRESTTEARLNYLLQRFRMSQENGDVIITAKEDLQALQLLYVENLILLQRKDKAASELKDRLLKGLLKIIQSSRCVVDECHEILRPDEIEKYPLGLEERMEKQEIQGQEIVFQYLILFCEEHATNLQDLIRNVDLLPAAQREIAHKIAESRIFDFTSDQKLNLVEYLLDYSKEIPLWLKTHEKLKLLTMARGVLLELLPSCKKDKIHTTYGLSKKDQKMAFVIPYSGNNTPIEGSIFESPHETLFKTYLFYLCANKTNFLDLADKILDIIHKDSEKDGVPKEETSMGIFCLKHFGKVTPSTLDLRNKPQIAALLYVTLVVGPTITFFEESIESTASNFSSMLGLTDYYSGTVYNEALYPKGLKPVKVKQTTAETLETVSSQFKKKGKIVTLSSIEAISDFVQTISKSKNCMMAIDTGALFNGYSNETIAKLIAKELAKKRKEIKAVLFFDDHNYLKALLVESQSIVDYSPEFFDQEVTFTYLDQNHAFGVDIPQKKSAHALVSIGTNTLAQIEQACWRLRGLKTLDQTVDFALLPECQDEMRRLRLDSTSLEGIIAYLVYVEHEKLKPHCLQATFQQMKNCIRQFLIEKTLELSTGESRSIIQEFNEFFLDVKTIDPIIYFGSGKRTLPVEEVIAKFREKLMAKILESSFLNLEEKRKLQLMVDSVHLTLLPELALSNTESAPHFLGTFLKQKQTLKEEVHEKELLHIEKPIDPRFKFEPEVSSFSSWEKLDTLNPEMMIAFNKVEMRLKKGAVPCLNLQQIFTQVNEPNFLLFNHFLRPDMIITHNVIPFTRLDRYSITKSLKGLIYSSEEETWDRQVTDLLVIKNKALNTFIVIGLELAESLIWEKKLLLGCQTPSHSFAVFKVDSDTCFNLGHVDPSIVAYTKSDDFKDLNLRYKIFNGSDIFTPIERTKMTTMIDRLLKSGIDKEAMIQALDKLYKIRRRTTMPSTRSPLAPLVELVADPSFYTTID